MKTDKNTKIAFACRGFRMNMLAVICIFCFLMVIPPVSAARVSETKPYGKVYTSTGDAKGDYNISDLRLAVKVTGRPVLIFGDRGDCSICESVWENSLSKGGGKFLNFLQTNKLLCYRLDNTPVFNKLRDYLTSQTNKNRDLLYEGKGSYSAPFFALILLDKDNSDNTGGFDANKDSKDIKTVLGVYAFGDPADKTLSKISAWLTALLDSEDVKKAIEENGSVTPIDDPSDPPSDEPVDDPTDPPSDEPVDDPTDPPSDDPSGDPTSDIYKWYTTGSEVRKAVKASDRPVLIFGGKPDCSVCEKVWEKVLQAEGDEIMGFMKKNKIIGLHIENLSLFTSLRNAFSLMENGKKNDSIFGGSSCSYVAPWLAFVKLKEDNLNSTSAISDSADVEILFGVVATASGDNKTPANVEAWLEKMMKTNEFQEAFKVKAVPLNFWKTAADLGTLDGGKAIDTAAGVGKYATSFASDVTERSFSFAGKKGQRYVFSVTASAAEGAPTLAELQALSQKLTCKITKDGASTALVTKTGAGFTALDNGIFFEPTANATYVLTLKLNSAPKNNVPFTLRFHNSDYDATAGSFSTPLWKGVAKGKWSMDIDAACKQTSPFFMYVGAVGWCPHCVSLDRLVMSTPEFKEAVAQYPLVMLDNRRRGEVTGPTLLYSDTYAAYVKSVDANADFEKKLADNHDWQMAHLVGDAATIGYPTLLLCKPNGDGTVRIVSRVCPTNFPVDTVFSEYATDMVGKLTAMLDDAGEEVDNYADTADAEISLTSATAAAGAYIGGYDSVDWRKVTFSDTVDWEICVQKPQTRAAGVYASDAVVTLSLYTAEGEAIGQGVDGSWSDPPSIEFSSTNDDEILARVTVSGQENSVVPYELVCTATEIPEYEICFAQNDFNVIGTDGDCEVKLRWKRIKASETNNAAQAMLTFSKGTCAEANPFVFQTDDEISEGELTFTVKGVGKGCEDSPSSQDFQVELEKISNCRVTGDGVAKMRVYTLPAFAGYANGDTISVKMVQGMTIEPIVLPFYSAYGDVSFTKASMPSGLNVSLSEDQNSIIISAKPNVSGDKKGKITLLSDSEEAAYINIAFSTSSLESINPAAAKYTSFTGRILDEDGMTVGLVSFERGATSIAAKATGAVKLDDTLDDWLLSSDNAVVASKENVISISLPPDGKGVGTLTADDRSYTITFRGNLESVSKDDYLGSYNVYLGADDDCGKYYGYGFLQMTVAADGSAVISGELPNGDKIAEVTSHATLDEENGLVPFFAETAGGSAIGGALRIVPALQRQEGEGCVSACESDVALKWNSVADEKVIGITLCGVAFDTTRSVTEQMKGEDGTIFTLNFYAVWDSQRSSKTVIPSGVRKQGLLAGVPIVEAADGKSFATELPEGVELYPGQELKFNVNANGQFNGSFKLLKSDGTLDDVDFCGIFIPYQASCCGTVPPALAYGHFLYGGKSWSILVIPYVTADVSTLKELTISTALSSKKIVFKTTGSTTGSLRALVSEAGVEALAVDKANFKATDTTAVKGKRISAVSVDYGMIVVPKYSFEYNEISAFGPKTLVGDDAEATSGLFALALPEDMAIISVDTALPTGATFYIYDSSRHVFTRSSDPAKWQPGQAFFVNFNSASATITLRLSTVSQGEDAKATGKTVFQGEPSDAVEGTLTYWDAVSGAYTSNRPDVKVPSGLLNGVWLKK